MAIPHFKRRWVAIWIFELEDPSIPSQKQLYWPTLSLPGTFLSILASNDMLKYTDSKVHFGTIVIPVHLQKAFVDERIENKRSWGMKPL